MAPRLGVAALAVAALLATVVIEPLLTNATTTAITFTNFVSPSKLGKDAGEPTIGINWKTGAVMYLAGLNTLRVSKFDTTHKTATWTDVSALLTTLSSLDPILYTDVATGRTFVSQLGPECSVLAFTDDDGKSWTQNPVGCGVANGPDHQTVGGGPFAPPLKGGTALSRDSVYYCAHSMVVASCSLSINGGLTFGPPVPIFRPLTCSGGHGHLRVAPDGTVYVPHTFCGGMNAVLVSPDNGTTWSTHKIPASTSQGESDPSVAVGSKGTVYFGYQRGSVSSANSYPYVAVSKDKGVTWQHVQNVGKAFGIRNVQFPAMIAGDDNRAAFAFLGSTTGGNDQSSAFKGVWRLYISITTDGGRTWKTVDATPHDPVQRGTICMIGIACKSGRNLLDFMDIAIDRNGRVYVAYADGCIGSCVSGGGASASSRGAIARQSSGPDLIGAR